MVLSRSNAADVFDSIDGAQFVDQPGEVVEVVDIKHNDAACDALGSFEGDGTHVEVHLVGDVASDFLQ